MISYFLNVFSCLLKHILNIIYIIHNVAWNKKKNEDHKIIIVNNIIVTAVIVRLGIVP